MERIIHLKFTDSESDTELYNWISEQKDMDEYIKGTLFKDMMEVKNEKAKINIFTDEDIHEIAREIELMFPRVKKEKNCINQITSKDLDDLFNDDSF